MEKKDLKILKRLFEIVIQAELKKGLAPIYDELNELTVAVETRNIISETEQPVTKTAKVGNQLAENASKRLGGLNDLQKALFNTVPIEDAPIDSGVPLNYTEDDGSQVSKVLNVISQFKKGS